MALTGLNACALASPEPDDSLASALEGFHESIEDRLTNCFDAQTLPDMNQCRNEGKRRAETYMREAEASLRTNFKVGEPKLLPLFERAQRACVKFSHFHGYRTTTVIPIDEAMSGIVASDDYGKSTILEALATCFESGEVKAGKSDTNCLGSPSRRSPGA